MRLPAHTHTVIIDETGVRSQNRYPTIQPSTRPLSSNLILGASPKLLTLDRGNQQVDLLVAALSLASKCAIAPDIANGCPSGAVQP